MPVPLAHQAQVIDVLISKNVIGKMRRSGDVSDTQADLLREYLLGVKDTIRVFREHEDAVRECLKREIKK